MEVRIAPLLIVFMSIFSGCSNSPELETGEIKTIQLLNKILFQSKTKNTLIDARTLISRKKIETADIPILFVELESGQNGTLVPYPGQGIKQTWLGADGATITLDRGFLKASRGMGDDIMGSSFYTPNLAKIGKNTESYNKKVSYLNGNNKIYTKIFICKIKRAREEELLELWELTYTVIRYDEICSNGSFSVNNVYYLDKNKIMRQSIQYHSDTIGFILTQRLDG